MAQKRLRNPDLVLMKRSVQKRAEQCESRAPLCVFFFFKKKPISGTDLRIQK